MVKKVSSIVLKLILIVFLILMSIGVVFAGLSGGAILEVMKTAPEIDANIIKYEMSQNSTIVDEDGNRYIAGKHFRLFAGVSQPDTRSAELTGHKPAEVEIAL